MNFRFLDERIEYDGSQLRPHFVSEILREFGNGIVAFEGACEIPFAHMVDKEDVYKSSPIRSPLMLHFIGEFFLLSLRETVLLQRLFMRELTQFLSHLSERKLKCKGDDIYLGGDKLSISIVTATPTSTLMHVGVNIRTDNTPVPTVGLEQLGVDSKVVALHMMNWLAGEMKSIEKACSKVKPVI